MGAHMLFLTDLRSEKRAILNHVREHNISYKIELELALQSSQNQYEDRDKALSFWEKQKFLS